MGEKFIPGGPKRYAHQRRGLRRMIETKGITALLFDPGTGKTATTLDYASLLALKSPTQEARVLVIAPLVAVDSWVLQSSTYVSPQVNFWAEALGGSVVQRIEALAARGGAPFAKSTGAARSKKVTPSKRALHVQRSLKLDMRPRVSSYSGPGAVPGPRLVLEVLNIDSFTQRRQIGSKTTADLMLEAVKRFNPDLVVVDESHKIKSASSNVSRLMSRISKVVPRRIILTGTVMPHSPLDVFGQWQFLDPFAFGATDADGSRRQATFGGFKARYAKLGGWMGKEVVGFQRLDEMQDIMALNSAVARKEEALDLPPTTDVEVPVDLSPAERKAYKEMKDSLKVEFAGSGNSTSTNRLTQMMRLRQITSGYLPDDNGNVVELGRSKVNTIASLVHDTLAGEKRIVVFALFRHEIAMLEKALEQKGTEVMVISGDTTNRDRMAMRARFGSDDPKRMVMVAQIKTMSLAVNELVTASHAIFASMSQQRDDWVQGRDRLNRIGQKRPVTFWNVGAPGTVDNVILNAHRDRNDLEAAMLDHVFKETSL